MLRRLVALDSLDARSWYDLGAAEYRLRAFVPSAEAYERAAALGHQTARARYEAGCSRALAGQVDAAVTRLEAALATGFSNKYTLLADQSYQRPRSASVSRTATERSADAWLGGI